MRILVLGGNGFIGRHVVRALAGAGHDLRVYDRGARPPLPDLPDAAYLTGDLADTVALAKALVGIDTVCHLISTTVPATAELDPMADVQGNLIGTLGLLAEMERQGIRRLVYLSSGGTVYGPSSQVPIPESHALRPINSYGIVKVATESFLARQIRRGLMPVVLRAANVYGPGQPKTGLQGIIGTVLQRLATGDPLELLGDGSIIRDFLHVRDLAELCLCAVSATAPVTVNAGSGRGTSLAEVIGLAEQVTGRRLELIRRPARAEDVPISILDIGLAGQHFGWSPAIALEDGLAETWGWVQRDVSRERRS